MDYFDFDHNGLACIDSHIPYCTSSGEEALIRSQVFRNNGLTLYCNVPLNRLPGAVDTAAAPWQDAGRISYLICRGDKALLAIALDSSQEPSEAPRFSFQYRGQTSPGPNQLSWALADEEIFYSGRITPLLDALKQLIASPRRAEYPCRIHLLTAEEFQRCSQPCKALLVPTDRGTYITEYGVRQGLFRARTKYGASLFCGFSSDMKNLEDAEFRQEIHFPDAVAFRDRASRARDGLPCRGESVAEQVRSLAGMPLSEYLRDFPETLERFRKVLGAGATYQDAARYVARLMRQEQPGVCAFNEEDTPGKQRMQDLAAPIIASFSKRTH